MASENILWLEELDLGNVKQDLGAAQAARTIDNHPIRLAGKTYEHGIGTHSKSEMIIDLKGAATRFEAIVGTDDEVEGRGSVVFEVWVDDKLGARSDLLTGDGAPEALSADLTGAHQLILAVKDGGDGNGWDHADWADAKLTLDPSAASRPESIKAGPFYKYAARETGEPYIHAVRAIGAVAGAPFRYQIPAVGAGPLVYSASGLPVGLTLDENSGLITGSVDPIGEIPVDIEVRGPEGVARRRMTIISIDLAHGVSPEPVVSGPRVVGATPGRPFLFSIPASGEGPLSYSAANLPEGLSLDSETGIITGSLACEGEFPVDLIVTGPKGIARRKLTIIGGDHKLALTPPMGWNSWNAWGMAVDDEKVRAAADSMVSSGLAARGFTYVNIDDGWEGDRDSNGEILTNEKFPDMKALADYVHSKGLKIGIYSSPGPKTCGGMEGSYQHEEQDALTWSKWGFDYIKYDWCSYAGIVKPPLVRADHEKPYRILREALDKCDRDIVMSICWSEPEVHIWGPEVGGNLWRTCGDIVDTWASLSGNGFRHVGYENYSSPGHWNDPDMLILGKVGWGPNLHQTRLTPYEQITHITLWSLLAAPLLIGCDMTQFDEFTLALLTNDEVIDIDQDPLGKQAARCSVNGDTEVWARPLFDGATAAGLFNRGDAAVDVTAKWSDLGISGSRPVRDLWRKKDLGDFSDSFTATVPPHGAVLVRIGA